METPPISIPVLPYPFKNVWIWEIFSPEFATLAACLLAIAFLVLYRAWKRLDGQSVRIPEKREFREPTETKFEIDTADPRFLEKTEAVLRKKFSLETHWTTEECLRRPVPSDVKRLLLDFRKFRYAKTPPTDSEKRAILADVRPFVS